MPLRMIDWQCVVCGERKEEITVVSSGGTAIAPRHCGQPAKRLIGAPAIRTNDNAPHDMRSRTTAGHVKEGATVYEREVWDTQLGKTTKHMTPRELEHYCKTSGIEIVPNAEYDRKHLSHEPPPPKLEDDPKLLRESEEEFADQFDRWEAGKLPEVETPLLDQDAEGKALVEQMASAPPAEVTEGA